MQGERVGVHSHSADVLVVGLELAGVQGDPVGVGRVVACCFHADCLRATSVEGYSSMQQVLAYILMFNNMMTTEFRHLAEHQTLSTRWRHEHCTCCTPNSAKITMLTC